MDNSHGVVTVPSYNFKLTKANRIKFRYLYNIKFRWYALQGNVGTALTHTQKKPHQPTPL